MTDEAITRKEITAWLKGISVTTIILGACCTISVVIGSLSTRQEVNSENIKSVLTALADFKVDNAQEHTKMAGSCALNENAIIGLRKDVGYTRVAVDEIKGLIQKGNGK